MLTEAQRAWVDAMTRSMVVMPRHTYKPAGRVRLAMWALVRDSRFELGVMAVILLNVLVMATVHCAPNEFECDAEPAGWETFWRVSNYVFSLLFR